jgi:TniQ
MPANETALLNFNTSRIAGIANQPEALLRRLAMRHSSASDFKMLLLGKQIGTGEVNVSSAKVCVQCVQEKGFIEAHWHLELMVACPAHGGTAVWFCAKCRKTLTWDRRGLLICKCGAPISLPHQSNYTVAELSLLELLRRKALDLCEPAKAFNGSNLPKSQLERLSLQQFLSLLRFLGKNRLIASWSREPQRGKQLLCAAARVLSDWPTNYTKLLRDLSPLPTDTSHRGEDAGAISLSRAYKEVGDRVALRMKGNHR